MAPTARPITAAEIQAIRSIAADAGQPYAAFTRLCDEVERLYEVQRVVHSITTAENQAEERFAIQRLISIARSDHAEAA